MCLSPGSLLAPPIVKMWRKIKLPQRNALGKHYTQYALLRDFCCTRACLKGIRIFERLWERRICVPDPAFPKFTFPSLSLLHPRDTHQLRTANWSPPAECLGKAVSWVQVLHLLATLKGLQRLTILTEKFYLISWEFRVLLKFGFLVQLFSFCPIILLIETSSVLGNNCFVIPVTTTTKHRKTLYQMGVESQKQRTNQWLPVGSGGVGEGGCWAGGIRGTMIMHKVSYMGFPCGSAGKESASNAGDPGLNPESGRSPREGIGYPLQYSWAALVVQLVKNPPEMWETWVQSLSWEDTLERR